MSESLVVVVLLVLVLDAAFLRLAGNSFALAAGVAGVCVAHGVLVAYAVRLHRGRLSDLLSRVAVLGYSNPGAVIAVGVLFLVQGMNGAMAGLPGLGSGAVTRIVLSVTVLALVYGYAVRFMAIGFSTVESGFELRAAPDRDRRAPGGVPQPVDPEAEEDGVSEGATMLETHRLTARLAEEVAGILRATGTTAPIVLHDT